MKQNKLEKRNLIELIISELNRELDAVTQSAKAAHEAATHEESKQEDSHDTRGLEASYLAGAQMSRIEALKKTMTALQFMKVPDFHVTDAIDIGALIDLDSGGKKIHYFLASQGGGISVLFNGMKVQVITPQAPLGEALFGRKVGDVIEVEGQRTSREFEIIGIC